MVDEACLLLWVRAAGPCPCSGAANGAQRAAAHACVVEAIASAPVEFAAAARLWSKIWF